MLGILAGIAVVERVAGHGDSSSRPIEVVAFADEEGVRYGVPYLGSAAYAGTFDTAWLELVDADGIAVADAIRAAGGDPDGAASAERPDLAGYLELHIEQGPVLEDEGIPVGVVEAIAGQTRASLAFRGRAGHAGTLPMDGRRDALAAAAEVVLAVERLGRETAGLVATVGSLAVEPGASNVVPGEAHLSLDARSGDGRHAYDGGRRRLREEAERIASARGIELEWATLAASPAVEMAPRCARRSRSRSRPRVFPSAGS